MVWELLGAAAVKKQRKGLKAEHLLHGQTGVCSLHAGREHAVALVALLVAAEIS